MCFKIGIRNNLRYPLIFMLLKSLLDFDEMFMRLFCGYYKGYFIFCTLIFLSQLLSGLIPLLIQEKVEINGSDNFYKILILLLIASYFNFIGTIVRRKYFSQINNNLPARDHFIEFRFKSIQIEASVLLCYLTMKIKIYRHQLISLIIICVILILIMIIDMFDDFQNLPLKIKYFLLTAFSCITRAFLDTIDKYLFEFNYLRPYTILLYEGIIGTIFNPMLLLIDNDSYKDFSEVESTENNIVLLIFLFIIFLILSSFKNMYRVLTVQYYSPMTRALTESILDPFILLYYFILFKEKKVNDYVYFILIIICLIIAAICSLIYNDFIILYCCEMERNTYLEINNRLYSDLFDEIINEDDNDNDNDNNKDDNNGKQTIELITQN